MGELSWKSQKEDDWSEQFIELEKVRVGQIHSWTWKLK